MIDKLKTLKVKTQGGLDAKDAAKHFNMLIEKINEIIAELNIFIQEREHYCKVYEEVVKPAMLPDKTNLYTSIGEMKIPANINGIGDCIVYAKCAKCRDNFQIDKSKCGNIVIYCPCCGKVLNYKRI